jgi:hypothetical protein
VSRVHDRRARIQHREREHGKRGERRTMDAEFHWTPPFFSTEPIVADYGDVSR